MMTMVVVKSLATAMCQLSGIQISQQPSTATAGEAAFPFCHSSRGRLRTVLYNHAKWTLLTVTHAKLPETSQPTLLCVYFASASRHGRSSEPSPNTRAKWVHHMCRWICFARGTMYSTRNLSIWSSCRVGVAWTWATMPHRADRRIKHRHITYLFYSIGGRGNQSLGSEIYSSARCCTPNYDGLTDSRRFCHDESNTNADYSSYFIFFIYYSNIDTTHNGRLSHNDSLINNNYQ